MCMLLYLQYKDGPFLALAMGRNMPSDLLRVKIITELTGQPVITCNMTAGDPTQHLQISFGSVGAWRDAASKAALATYTVRNLVYTNTNINTKHKHICIQHIYIHTTRIY